MRLVLVIAGLIVFGIVAAVSHKRRQGPQSGSPAFTGIDTTASEAQRHWARAQRRERLIRWLQRRREQSRGSD